MSLPDILIVDDSLTVRMALAETLEAAGFAARACGSGAEARRALAEETFSLAILDVLLPDDDGVELLRLIRETPRLRGMAVIMLSTESEVRHRLRGLAAGADDYVGKPYDPAYLTGRVRDHLRRQSGRAPAGTRAVLLIDDSATFRAAVGGMLEQAGYPVVAAESGEEGLRLAADTRPAAAIIDGSLPGIDGATVIRRMRLDPALRHIPCLMLTGSDEAGAELRALDAGADAFVRKGEEGTILLARLKVLLRGAGGAEGGALADSLQAPKRVLAVGEDDSLQGELAEALRGEGFEVLPARSGSESLALLAVQPMDCIVMDLSALGADGLDSCRRLRAAPGLRDTPVIMLSRAEDRRAMVEAFAAGADDHLARSSDAEVLRARLLAQIRRKRRQDETRRIREELLRRDLAAAAERAAREGAEARAEMAAELELKNQELEAFSYSVAHDLRAPLRAIDGFSLALLEDCADRLDDEAQGYLGHLRTSVAHMARLIDDLLSLSRVTRSDFLRDRADLSAIARTVIDRLRRAHPERRVEIDIAGRMTVSGDPALLGVALENLLGNAWKFTGKRETGHISFHDERRGGERVFVIRDDGAGFDMAQVGKLFNVFTRLHSAQDFEGTGIGLATVLRVVRRHGGRVWAEGKPGEGAAFFFTLEPRP